MPRIERTTKTASRVVLAVFWAAAACLVAAPSAGFARGQKREVLIYYANETAPDETESRNYATLIGWLEGSTAQKARKSAESLQRDVLLFPAAVDLETHTIRHMLPRSGWGAGAVIFTNRLVRRGKFLLYRPGWEEFAEMDVTPPEFDNYILTSNPLCVEACFAAMLAEVARRFDPAGHRFLLVTKSHGSREMSLVPRLAVRHEETTREEVLALVEGRIPDDERPGWVGKVGVTKKRYLAVLRSAGRSLGMRFPLVVMESCDGAIDPELQANLPENVGRLCVIDRYAATYVNLLYGDVLQQAFTADTLPAPVFAHRCGASCFFQPLKQKEDLTVNALRLTTLSLALAATLALVACGSLQIVGHVVVAGTEIGNGSAVEEPALELAFCEMSDPSCDATPPVEIDRVV